jgi:hypothetical protein
MMSFYAGDSTTVEGQGTCAALPLPPPAVVIDVRQGRQDGFALLEHLIVAVEDLAAAQRRRHIPRWRYLTDCIDFLHLHMLAPATSTLLEETSFVLTTRTGKQISIQHKANLASFIGRSYLDAVRNARMSAAQDSLRDPAGIATEMIDTAAPTVHVFFVADMDDPASLSRAACYAQLLKAWTWDTHGPARHGRTAPLQVVLFCLNALASSADSMLVEAVGHDSAAIDTVLLLERYSDDEAYVGGLIQLSQAELILYTLLLYWPVIFTQTLEDASSQSVPLLASPVIPLWSTYILGASALEHSAHWAARWLNYGITARALATIAATEELEQEEPMLRRAVQNWLQRWWQELQEVVPAALIGNCDELAAFARLQRILASSAAHSRKPRALLRELETLRQQVSTLYSGPAGTLQQALESRGALPEQIRRLYQTHYTEEDEGDAQLSRVAQLSTAARQFVAQHFQGPEGALPRAIRQLVFLRESATTLGESELQPPDLDQCRADFEYQAGQAIARLSRKIRLWRVPLLGSLPRSTVVLWLLVILLAIVVITGSGWQSIVEQIPALPLSIGTIKVLLVAVLVGAGLVYLAARNRAIQCEYCHQRDRLCQTVRGHLSKAGRVIAASVALALLTRADLYTEQEEHSPYEKRLLELAGSLPMVRQQAAYQHALADTRLKAVLKRERRHPTIRREIVRWQQIEDAFLSASSELKAGALALAPLSEMLLRLLGAESLPELLASMLSSQKSHQTRGAEARFQLIETLLTAIALTEEIRPPDLSALLPVLRQYTGLKERYLQEPQALNGHALEVAGILRENLLEQAQGRNNGADESLRRQALPAAALAAWIGVQFNNDPHLASVFEPDDVLLRLADEKITPARLLGMLRSCCPLPTRRSAIAGSDYSYLLMAPGEASTAFIRSRDQLYKEQTQLALFPDEEKVVYLHIHHVRQL